MLSVNSRKMEDLLKLRKIIRGEVGNSGLLKYSIQKTQVIVHITFDRSLKVR